jgi:serine/threonine protein kinase
MLVRSLAVRLEVAQAGNIRLVMQRAFVNGRYVVERLLGSGGMAQVYLTYDEVLDRHVALKVLRDQYADDEEFTQRFRQEARSVASLSHPNIVSVYDQGRSEDGAHYIAMEYVPGGTLKEHIRREGHLEPAAVGVVLQIANVLSEAHDKGVIHRDIKPQNVLVTDKGDVKVTGLGIARDAESVSSDPTATRGGLGNSGLHVPRASRGEPVGYRSDLYSLGVVLYEMLTRTRSPSILWRVSPSINAVEALLRGGDERGAREKVHRFAHRAEANERERVAYLGSLAALSEFEGDKGRA